MRVLKIWILLGCLASSTLVSAQTPDALQVRSWAAACANCHGTARHGTEGQALAPLQPLAGLPDAVIVQRMQDFKAGKVPSATVMHQLAKGYSDAQIAAIAAYFAAQKR
jgi:sulfide dehydrogenase cytochrome subunit